MQSNFLRLLTVINLLIVATDRVKLKDGKTYIDEATGYTAKETEFHKVTCFNGLSRSGASRQSGRPAGSRKHCDSRRPSSRSRLIAIRSWAGGPNR